MQVPIISMTHYHWHCYQVHHPFTMHHQRVSWVNFILVSHIRVHLTTFTCFNEVCHIFVHPQPPILLFYFREHPSITSLPCPRAFMIFRYQFPLVLLLANNSQQCVHPPKMSSLKEVLICLLPNPFSTMNQLSTYSRTILKVGNPFHIFGPFFIPHGLGRQFGSYK